MSIYQQSTIEIIHQEIVPFSAEVDDPQRVVNISVCFSILYVGGEMDNTFLLEFQPFLYKIGKIVQLSNL
jgi:hypothetical protein